MKKGLAVLLAAVFFATSCSAKIVNTGPTPAATVQSATTAASKPASTTAAKTATTASAQPAAAAQTTTQAAGYTWSMIPDWPATNENESSNDGSPNSRANLSKQWPEFAADDTVNLTCLEQGWTGPDADKDIITPEIQKRTGLKINYTPMTIVTNDDLVAKENLMVSSGDIPDVYFGYPNDYDRQIYAKLGQAGLIYDMTDRIKNYPFIHQLLKPEMDKYAIDNGSGGKVDWFLPTQTGRGNNYLHTATIGSGLYVRKDFLDQLKMDYPKNLDEYKTYLQRCVNEIKTVNGQPIIPYICDENLGGFSDTFINLFFPINRDGYSFDPNNNYEPYNQRLTGSEYLLNGLKWVNMMYQSGLFSKEIISIKRDQFMQEVSSGRVASFNQAFWDMNTFADAAKAVVPNLMYVSCPELDNGQYPVEMRKWTYPINMYSTLTFSTKLDEKTVNHFLAFMDYLTTRDGQLLVQAGIPGVTYNLDNQKYTYTDDFKNKTGNLDWNKGSAYGVFYWQQLVFNTPAFLDNMGEFPELAREDNMLGWQNRQSVLARFDPNMAPPKDYYFIMGPVELSETVALGDEYTKMIVEALQEPDPNKLQGIMDKHAAVFKTLKIDDIMAERKQIIDSVNIPQQ